MYHQWVCSSLVFDAVWMAEETDWSQLSMEKASMARGWLLQNAAQSTTVHMGRHPLPV